MRTSKACLYFIFIFIFTFIFTLPAPGGARIPGVEPLKAAVACDGRVRGHRDSRTG